MIAMTRTKMTFFLGAASLIVLSACADPSMTGHTRAQQGAITGAMVGGVYGLSRGGDNSLARTAVGAVIGAAAGGAIGTALDRQAGDLRRDLDDNVSVVNTGNQLVVTMPQDILFATDSAAVRPALQGDLRALAANLQSYPDTSVDVIGHTDSTGAAAYNQDLSARRANAVANVLLQNGVPSWRVRAFGRGEDAPVASNLTAQGREQNRRVEIIIRPN
ncbi:MAG: OmpA family protein [Paracoccaceae bacterium]